MYNEIKNAAEMKSLLVRSIKDYSTTIAQTDKTFAKNLLRKDKSPEKCADYLFRIAEAVYVAAKGRKNGGMFTSYQDDCAQIVHYYQESNEDLEAEIKYIKANGKPAKSSKPEAKAKAEPKPKTNIVPMTPKVTAPKPAEEEDWLNFEDGDEDGEDWLNLDED